MAEKSRVFEAAPAKLNGVDVPLVVTRMSVDAWTDFRTEFRHMQARAARSGRVMAADGDDQAFEAAIKKSKEDDLKATAFARHHITEYVSVDPSCDHRDDDGLRVVTGAELFEMYGRDLAATSTILATIFIEHLLTAKQKKALRSAPDSGNGSAALTLALGGDKPAPTAASAEPSSTAVTAAATASPNQGASSGTTVP